MKRYILTLISLFFIITHVSGNAYGQERIQLYPTNVQCGESLSIGLAGLDAKKTYSIVIECGNLSCANDFEPIVHAISNKTHSVITENFNIFPGCDDSKESTPSAQNPNEPTPVDKAPIPAGQYLVQLYDSNNKSLSSKTFYLVSNANKICELKTAAVAKLNTEHPFELATSQACVFNMSIVDPNGVRIPVVSQFIDSKKPKEFKIPANKLLKEGAYKLTAVATPQCNVELDRECKFATFEVVSSETNIVEKACVFSGSDSVSNCTQCGSGYVCREDNTCTKDLKASCTSTGATADKTEQVTETSLQNTFALATKNKNLIILIAGVCGFSIIALVLLFRFFRYRIR